MDTKSSAGRINKRLYSIPEAAAYLGRSVWSMREMVWAGKLPAVRDGRRIFIDLEDMNRWIELNKVKETL